MRAFVLAQVASLDRFSLAQKPDTKLLYVASTTGLHMTSFAAIFPRKMKSLTRHCGFWKCHLLVG